MARQLAMLMIALLCSLLLGFGGVVYIATQDLLSHSARHSLQERAAEELRHLIEETGRKDERDHGRQGELDERETGGIFVTFLGRQLQVRGGSPNPFGSHVPERAAALLALRTAHDSFASRQVGHDERYLIYTRPAILNGRVVGVEQVGIAVEEFEESLAVLLHVLLLAGAAALLISGFITGLVVRRALRPVRAALSQQRDFVANAAHELRTPLTIIRSTAELALLNGTEEEQRRAEQTLRQTGQLTRLANDLLLLAQADSGALELAQEPVALDRLVTETLSDVEALAEDRGVHLETDLAPKVHVMGDAGRLRQLLLILLDNSLKHTPRGGRIEVRMERQGGEARLSIHDSGHGIASDDLPHLFDRFYQADPARTAEGFGLGLSIAQWITMMHAGKIEAGNAAGGGAIFTVTLPLAS